MVVEGILFHDMYPVLLRITHTNRGLCITPSILVGGISTLNKNNPLFPGWGTPTSWGSQGWSRGTNGCGARSWDFPF